MRFNQQIWKLAKWLWTNFPTTQTRNEYYDKASALYGLLVTNGFTTTEDQHYD